MVNIHPKIQTFLAVVIQASLIAGLSQAASAQDQKFSCDRFGSGFTLHPEFPYTCCYPGTLPVPGEMRCTATGKSEKPILQSTPSDGQGTDRQCISPSQVCIIGGISCCTGACTGTFPNTYCQ